MTWSPRLARRWSHGVAIVTILALTVLNFPEVSLPQNAASTIEKSVGTDHPEPPPAGIYWKLVTTEEDPDGHSHREALGALTVETTQGAGVWTYEKVGRDRNGQVYVDWKFRLDFTVPPPILKPGQVVTLTVNGTAQSENKRHPSKAWGAFFATGAKLKWVRTVRGTTNLPRAGWFIGSSRNNTLDAPEGLAEFAVTVPGKEGPDKLTIWSVAQSKRNIVARYTYQKVSAGPS